MNEVLIYDGLDFGPTMEVAGVVLGVIPIIFYALENYHRAYAPLKDTKNWKETIETICCQVELQRQQLRITLSSLQIDLTDTTTLSEIKHLLQLNHPTNWGSFVTSICRMNDLMN